MLKVKLPHFIFRLSFLLSGMGELSFASSSPTSGLLGPLIIVNISDFSDNLSLSGADDFIYFDNVTANVSSYNNDTKAGLDPVFAGFLSFVLALLIMFTIIGNVSVIVAISRDKTLQTKGNCLVMSLAVADLMVACLVMPLGAVYEVSKEWILGPALCDIWTSCDVLCCTASILHLVAIAIDRYWAVTNIDYVRQRRSWHVGLMISLVWFVALVVSVAPLIGWKDDEYRIRIEDEKRCLVSQDAGYQLFATCATFYVPLVAILLLYWRIYKVARKRIRHKPGVRALAETKLVSATILAPLVTEMTVISTTTTTSSSHANMDASSTSDLLLYTNRMSKEEVLRRKKQRKSNLRSKRERKAAKTLSIITGIFVICWLPFFIIALLMPLCKSCEPSNEVFSFALWLGYANSMVNPVIYTIFSPDFRTAFKQLFLAKIRA